MRHMVWLDASTRHQPGRNLPRICARPWLLLAVLFTDDDARAAGAWQRGNGGGDCKKEKTREAIDVLSVAVVGCATQSSCGLSD